MMLAQLEAPTLQLSKHTSVICDVLVMFWDIPYGDGLNIMEDFVNGFWKNLNLKDKPL